MTGGAFVVTPGGVVIGYSVWPWDDGYVPVVGCFAGGALEGTADCGQSRDSLEAPLIVPRLRGRAKRRVFRALGIHVPPLPRTDVIDLDGPDGPVWFRFQLGADLVARLRAGDPEMRIERLEDSAVVRPAVLQHPGGLTFSVEDLLNAPDGVSRERLDGFAAFLSAPPQHQFEALFVEYLRRMPEPGARVSHLYALQRDAIDWMQLRRSILDSEEFKARRVGYGARLGASLVSPLWRELAMLHAPLGTPAPSNRLRVSEFQELDDDAFVRAIHERALGQEADAAAVQRWTRRVAEQGRRRSAVDLCREAPEGSRRLEVV